MVKKALLKARRRPILPGLTKTWKDQVFATQDQVACFWCEAKLDREQATTDHVVSREMDGLDEPGNWQIACYDCNQLRARVSTLHGHLIRFELGHQQPWKYLETLDEDLLLFEALRQVYNQKLQGSQRRLCFREITEVARELNRIQREWQQFGRVSRRRLNPRRGVSPWYFTKLKPDWG